MTSGERHPADSAFGEELVDPETRAGFGKVMRALERLARSQLKSALLLRAHDQKVSIHVDAMTTASARTAESVERLAHLVDQMESRMEREQSGSAVSAAMKELAPLLRWAFLILLTAALGRGLMHDLIALPK